MTNNFSQQQGFGPLGSGATLGGAQVPQPLAKARKRLKKKLSPRSRKGTKIKQNPKAIALGTANLAKAREEKAKLKAATRPVTITLRNRFTINSAPRTVVRREWSAVKGQMVLVYEDIPNTGGCQTYGPGSVTVPQAVAAVLLEMQRNSEQVRAAEGYARNTVVIDERRTREVSDEAQLNAFLGFGPVAMNMRF